MKTQVTKIEEVSKLIIPPGTYQGIWDGYVVTIGEKWRLTTKEGVRGFNIPVTVIVSEDGSATVETNTEVRGGGLPPFSGPTGSGPV